MPHDKPKHIPAVSAEGYGLMELTNRDLISYAARQGKLTPIEVELMLRLEQVMDTTEAILQRIPSTPCGQCAHLAKLIPVDSDDAEEFIAHGATQWV